MKTESNQPKKKVYLIWLFLFLMVSIGWAGIVPESSQTLSMFRLKMTGLPNNQDECVIYYQEGSTNCFDGDYDAYKLFGPNPAPHISIFCDSTLIDINGIPPVLQTFTTSILVTTPVTGTFTISATDVQGFSPGTCIYLKDLFTNTKVNLLLGTYSFILSDTTTLSRFELSITYNILPTSSLLIQPDCLAPSGGKFSVSGNTDGPWNYFWRDTMGNVVKTSLGLTANDSLENLSGGSYIVEVVSAADACLRNEISFTINSVLIPSVSFTSVDTIFLGCGSVFSPTNLSAGCSSYSWNFGDSTSSLQDFEPSHVYFFPGNYSVKLIGTSITSCTDSMVKTISVMDLTTFISKQKTQSVKLINAGNNCISIKILSETINELQLNLYDLSGKNRLFRHYNNLKTGDDLSLNLSEFGAGIYLVSVKTENSVVITKKIFVY